MVALTIETAGHGERMRRVDQVLKSVCVCVMAGVAADAEPQRPFPGRVLPPPLLLGPPRCLLDPEEQRQVKPFADRLASRLHLRRFAVVFLASEPPVLQ